MRDGGHSSGSVPAPLQGPVLPRVLAITPPVGGPWVDELPALAEAGVDGLLVRLLGDPGAVPSVLLRARALFPAVLLRWQGPADAGRAAELGVGLHLPARRPARAVPGVRLTSTSCHDAGRVAQAASGGIALVTLSPIFPPGSKPDDTRAPLGLAALADASSAAAVLALGGMHAGRVAAVMAAGAHGVAGIGAFFAEGHVRSASAAAVARAVAVCSSRGS